MANKIFISSKRIAFFIALLGGVWAWLINNHNIDFLKESGFRQGHGMVLTEDDASYLAPSENFKRRGIWKDNSEGVSSYIQRPPLIGLINLGVGIFSKYGHLGRQKYLSIILHVLSLFLFGLMAVDLLGRKWAIVVQLVYAIIPCFWGYLFYHLTESITPSFLVMLFFGYVKYFLQPKPRWLILQGAIAGAILLTRPQLIIFIFPLFWFIIHFLKTGNSKKIGIVSLSLLLAFGGFGIWQIRASIIAHRIVGLHVIYDFTNNTQYRPIHGAFGELYKVWDYDGVRFHNMMTQAWREGLYHDTLYKDQHFDVLESLNGCKGITMANMNELIDEYKWVVKEQRETFERNGELVKEGLKEQRLKLKVEQITTDIRGKNFFLCYIKVPIRSAKFMFTKSQLNLAIFQYEYRGRWWMELLRYFCLILITSSVLFTFVQILNMKNLPVFFFAIGSLLYLIYLFFFQKINEERYLMPLLPLMFLFAMNGLRAFILKWRSL